MTVETRNVLKVLDEMYPNQNVEVDILTDWLLRIKELTKPISVLTSVLAYYGKTESHYKLLIETLERFTSLENRDGKAYLITLKYLPIQTVFYSISISLVMAKKHDLLNDIFTKIEVRKREYDRQPFALYISREEEWGKIPEMIYPNNRKRLPFEVLLLNSNLEEIFTSNQLAFDSTEFKMYYDLFEFLRSIKARYQEDHHYFTGCFGYKLDRSHIVNFLKEGAMEENWEVLSLFGNSKDNFGTTLKTLVEALNRQP